ncbi:MAG: thiopurine S-methyltransferase [Woeseiaceae bacterium]|nr:thiopurine S-methyltransferase [Woeseiaceae bacterium]
METWLERWREGRIGWHEDEGNASLKQHWRASGRSVLVPLCGKSVDLVWLAAQGNRVVGVEVSQIAVEAFFAEQQLEHTVIDGSLRRYDAVGVDITIYCGDFMALNDVQFDAHYDRGALVALHADLRPGYAAHVRSLLSDDAEQLVITLGYDQSVADGPPFCISDEELLGYWPGLECVDHYDDTANAPPKFLEAGLDEVIEKVWRSAPG